MHKLSATDRLRELLDERGVFWIDVPLVNMKRTCWKSSEKQDGFCYFDEDAFGVMELTVTSITPEQAIAATLGAVEYRKPTTLSQLEAENAKLREQMERLVTLLRNDCDIDASWDGLRGFWLIGLTENGCLMRDRACKAEAENDKLRELVRDMMVAWWACDNERCPRHDKRCEEGKFCAFDECAQELGIEVDA